MRLYYFTNAEFGLKDIVERRVKIAKIDELNDPFEFLSIDLSDRLLRKAVNSMKATLSKTRGLICLSGTWKSPLQWGHYADKHQGLCLGFDVSDEMIAKVDYVKRRISDYNSIDAELMHRLLTTKFKQWSYEKEYRLFVTLDEEQSGLYYYDFSREFALREVIVGARSAITRGQLQKALGDLASSVDVFKGRAAFTKFKVVRNKNENLWE